MTNSAIRVKKQNFSVVWIVPIVAALIGLWLVVQSVLMQGPTITIKFTSAEGLEVNKTKVRYKDVNIGQITAVHLSPDHKHVLVNAKIEKSAAEILSTDTQFFVVRPRITGSAVSGLSTLLSGAYIGVDVGSSAEKTKEFMGLETPPLVSKDSVGREFILRTDQIGSLSYGSPVYFRRIEAGQVTHIGLDKDGGAVTIRVFVNAPYDKYVTEDTRFWQASGVDVALTADGARVSTESLTTLLAGGLAFQDRAEAQANGKPAAAGTVFSLFKNREFAMRSPDTRIEKMTLYFPESLRGLSIGAPVDLRGIAIGEVTSIGVEYTDQGRKQHFPVEVNLYPDRLLARQVAGGIKPTTSKEQQNRILDGLVANGLRAQLKTGNLITGQMYIALDYFPNAAPAKMVWNKPTPVFPTISGGLGEMQDTVGRILGKVDKIPLGQMSSELVKAINKLNATLENSEKLTAQINNQLTPEITATLKEAQKTLNKANEALSDDAPLQHDVRETLKQVSKAARALSEVADLLDKNPQALLLGKEKVKP